MTVLKALLLHIPVLVSSFSIYQDSGTSLRTYKTQLFAASGPPQYEKFNAVLSRVEMVSNGAVMLHIETDEPVDYKAGNVLALEIQGDGTTEKSQSDALQNDGWMRGPYTVSRATEKSFDVLMKVVGDKSRAFASAKPGTAIRFGGKFKVPIVDGIDKEHTNRVVLLSTGVGVGPCIGAIEESMKEESFPPIELYASYRTNSEIISAEYLDSLNIKWKAVVTSETGRISASQENMAIILPPLEAGLSLDDTHYHIIGNGQMVKEWKDGLMNAGVSDSKVTVEMYHNFQASPASDAVERITSSITKNLCSTVK